MLCGFDMIAMTAVSLGHMVSSVTAHMLKNKCDLGPFERVASCFGLLCNWVTAYQGLFLVAGFPGSV